VLLIVPMHRKDSSVLTTPAGRPCMQGFVAVRGNSWILEEVFSMKTFLDCWPCFLKQTLDACRMITDDVTIHRRVLKQVLQRINEWSFEQSPPQMGREIHRIIREETGNPDPYREVKDSYNRFALELLPKLRKRVENSTNSFETAVRLAIAGNIMDLALIDPVCEKLVLETIEDTLTRVLSVNHIEDLRQSISGATSILYLGDNAGEIVLDRLLLELMPLQKVTFVVRGSPVINDATIEDAEKAGLKEFVSVMDNGTDIPGTVRAYWSACPKVLDVWDLRELLASID